VIAADPAERLVVGRDVRVLAVVDEEVRGGLLAAQPPVIPEPTTIASNGS